MQGMGGCSRAGVREGHPRERGPLGQDPQDMNEGFPSKGHREHKVQGGRTLMGRRNRNRKGEAGTEIEGQRV